MFILSALVLPVQASASSQFKLINGKDIEVCKTYKNNLDAFGDADLSCEREISSKYDQVIKKPEWNSLDIFEYRKLMALSGKFLDYGDTVSKNTVYDDLKNIDETAATQVSLKGSTMMTAAIDIDNDGVLERVLRYQSGICGVARYSYTTAILVLDNASDAVDAVKSQLLYPDNWRNPKTGEVKAVRDYHYVTYGIFALNGKTYFERMHSDGVLEIYKVSKGNTEEVCKLKSMTK